MKRKDYINKQFNSSKYGPYVILKDVKKEKCTYVEIEFLISGAHTITRLTNALNGKVRDPQYGLNFNKIYTSNNYGRYRVIDIYSGKINCGNKAKIKFIDTGYEKIVELFHAVLGDVYDNSATYKTPIDTSKLDNIDRNIKIKNFTYIIWREMIKRCYNNNADNYNFYGGNGISVCNEWKNINIFANDIKTLPQYEKWYRFPTLYQLDKDYLQLSIPKNKRIYSPKTCMFLYYADNINLSHIENRNNNNLVSNYFVVHKETESTYSASLSINNNNIYLGTFDNEIVAANVYNYWYNYYHNFELVPLLNNVPYVDPKEFIKHNTNPKVICTYAKERKNL